MSPTFFDVSIITGIPVYSMEVDSHLFSCFKVNCNNTYRVYMTTYIGKPDSSLSPEEHIYVLSMWLYHYVLYSKSIKITHEVFKLDYCLS